MAHLAERRKGLPTNALGRRLRRYQLRVLGLKRLQFVEQAIIFGVRHARLVEHVIAVVVGVDFAAQFGDALGGGLSGRHRTEP